MAGKKNARLRMTEYYLLSARMHRQNLLNLDDDQFEQIRRGWTMVSDEWQGLQPGRQAKLIMGYLNIMDGFLERRGLWRELLSWNTRGLQTALASENWALVGGILNDIGLCLRHLGQYVEAKEHLLRSLTIRRAVGPVIGEGVTLNNLGLVHDDLGQYQQAVTYYEQALEPRRTTGDRQGEGITLHNLATTLMQLGQWNVAVQRFEEALEIEQEVNDRIGKAGSLSNLGQLYLRLTDLNKAEACFEQAKDILREIGDRGRTVAVLNNLGLLAQAQGQQ